MLTNCKAAGTKSPESSRRHADAQPFAGRHRGACHRAGHFGPDPLARRYGGHPRLCRGGKKRWPNKSGYDENGRTTMPERPEAIVAGKKRPFTGAEFLESL